MAIKKSYIPQTPNLSKHKQVFRAEGGEEERLLRDSKLTALLATIGCAVGLENVWCFQ